MSGSSQPPGWYHAAGDAPGTHRYWDGAQWVGDPQPIPPAAAGAPGATLAGGHRLADPWPRIGARVIDTLIVFVPVFTILVATTDLDSAADTNTSAGFLIASLLLGIAYEVGFVAWKGGTPGKLLLGLRVIERDTGDIPPTTQVAFMRWLPTLVGLVPLVGSVISLLIGIMSLIWLFSDPGRRTVYDRVANTAVVNVG